MAKPDLYICHTAYQVMIDLLRTLRSGEKSALIISSTVSDAKNLPHGWRHWVVFLRFVYSVNPSARCPTLKIPL